jgi:hypothetical protein
MTEETIAILKKENEDLKQSLVVRDQKIKMLSEEVEYFVGAYETTLYNMKDNINSVSANIKKAREIFQNQMDQMK